MNDFDLERLGDVWRQQPDPVEMDRLHRSAAAVARRARWSQRIDVVAAVAVSAVVLLLVWANPQKATVAIGCGTVLLLLVSQRRQRRQRAIELQSLTGNAEEMIGQSIERVEATIRHTRFSLFTLPTALLLGLFFSYVVDADGGRGPLARISLDPSAGTIIKVLVALLVTAATIYLLRAMRRERAELERLSTLREAYRAEREIAAAD